MRTYSPEKPFSLEVIVGRIDGTYAKVSWNALIYTLLANCRAQDLDPEDYLTEVLKRLPHDATREQLAAPVPARIVDGHRTATKKAA